MSERIVQQPVSAEVQQKFSDLPSAQVERSTFDMSHSWKGTPYLSALTPVLLQEVLPGDTFNVESTFFMRLATPLKPLMDSITADLHFFFVPNRLVWDNWQAFMGERKTPDEDITTLSVPQANVDFNILNSELQLPDYFGLPLYQPATPDDTTPMIGQVSTLPFRAYQLIWNEWYRNQNVVGEAPIPLGDGPDDIDYTSPDPGEEFDIGNLLFRHKRGDYFTRALPWPQKGDAVFLPLGNQAPVVTDPDNNGYDFLGLTSNMPVYLRRDTSNAGNVSYTGETGQLSPDEPIVPALVTDLSTATAATINDIRTAFQIQKLLERDARGGTRYIEIILSHFNVQSPDMRLQRPEYLGGGSQRIVINPVAATVATTDAPQGELAAVGTGLVKARFNHSFTEHGHIMCIMSCRSDLTYQRGIDRSWSRKTRYEYYWPSLSHLGEQAIKNKELFYAGTAADEEVWGYQERYAEYRYCPSRITGKFRSESPASLDVWHLSQDFDGLPPLNNFFMSEIPPIERVIAVPSEPPLLVDGWHNVKATRPMPVYAVPGLVDHF